MSVHADPRIGSVVAGYRLEERVGRGGMSVVYRADDLALGRKVALKLMSPELSEDDHFRRRFRLESRRAAAVDHPNVIPIYEAGEVDGALFIAMRYVDGTDLEQLLRTEGPLEPRRALRLMAQVADGLDAAHERGLVHRDVKPSNVLVSQDGGKLHAYLADFGLTRVASSGEEAIQSSRLSGTTAYVSPEQIVEGTAAIRSDNYSLACMLYEGLTGQVPYPREQELQVLWAHLHDPPPRPSNSNPQLPEALDEVIARGMAKDPAGRYATGAELVEAARASFPDPARRLTGRRLALAALLVFVLAAAAVLAVFLLSRDKGVATATTGGPSGGAVQVIDAETASRVARVPLAAAPADVAADADGGWIVDAQARTVSKVDPATGKIGPSGLLRGRPAAIAVGPNGVWIARADPATLESGLVLRVDEATAAVVEERSVRFRDRRAPFLRVADVLGDLALAGRRGSPAVWVTIPRELDVREVISGARVDTGTRVPRGVAFTDGAVWVSQVGRVLRIDPSARAVVAAVELPFSPLGIATGAGAVWVTDGLGDSLTKIDAVKNRVIRTTGVGGSPGPLAVGAGAVWVGNRRDRTVSKVDPESGRLLATVPVGGEPTRIAVGGGRVWVAVRSTPESGGRLTVAAYEAQVRELGARLAEDYGPLLLELREAVGGSKAEGLELFRTLPLQQAAILEAAITDLDALRPPERFRADQATFVADLRNGVDVSRQMASIAAEGDTDKLWALLVRLDAGPPAGSTLSPEFRQFFDEYLSNFPNYPSSP